MKCVQEHRNTFDKNNLRDLVDIYINAQKDRGFDDCELASKMLKIKSNSTFNPLCWFVLRSKFASADKRPTPSLGRKFSFSCSFGEKIGQIIACPPPPPRLTDTPWTHHWTRMHSSRMHTTHALIIVPIWGPVLEGGGLVLGGVGVVLSGEGEVVLSWAGGGCLPPGQDHLPPGQDRTTSPQHRTTSP